MMMNNEIIINYDSFMDYENLDWDQIYFDCDVGLWVFNNNNGEWAYGKEY